MTLANKHAVIYGAGGSLGGAVASAFAAAGARVFLTGRTLPPLQKIASEISSGNAEVDIVDAMDEDQVNAHLEKVIGKTGSIDISFNAIGYDVVQNMAMVDMKVEDFVSPAATALKTQFITSRAAARAMMKRRAGVILTLTATPGGIGYPYTGGFGPACNAIEAFVRNFAAEIGISGVRVVNMRSAGSPDSRMFADAIQHSPDVMNKVIRGMKNDTMLKQLPMIADIANVAVFLASDLASKITGVTIDVTSGSTGGYNYRVPRADSES
jgi:3-oxoacyl-[acyl-carrier protein] reductase